MIREANLLTYSFSIWRPLNNAIANYLLAVCDSCTIAEGDMVEADHVRRHYTGSSLFALYNLMQKWSYKSGQEPYEAILMKLFDSQEHPEKRQWLNYPSAQRQNTCPVIESIVCPHVLFENPLAAATSPPRESIEVRALPPNEAVEPVPKTL